MFEEAFVAMEDVVAKGVSIIGFEAIVIMGAFAAVIGVALGLKVLKKVNSTNIDSE